MSNEKLFFAFALAVILIFSYLSINEILLVNNNRQIAQRQKIVDERFDELVRKHEHLKDLLKSSQKFKEIKFEDRRTRKSSGSVLEHGYVDSLDNDELNSGANTDSEPRHERKPNMIYILKWTHMITIAFIHFDNGQTIFIERKCKHTNCFVTSDKKFLKDYTLFDVILFEGPQLIRHYTDRKLLPHRRSTHQKYVFASVESADFYPLCSSKFDYFFNWTWTYRLDSEMTWRYIIVKDLTGKIIGPKKDMHWLKLENMEPVSDELRNIFVNKRRAAAWFVSNCKTVRKRETFAKNLSRELRKYELEIDIYGKCGTKKCSFDDDAKCNEMIETDYFFYLSFENTFSEDYVTEKLLRALQNSAIPVVYGGANYTRFMPDGIYLNARELGVEKLAAKMNELIEDRDKYAEYFKWRNHYSYHSTSDFEENYCKVCAMLNDEKKLKQSTVYEKFRNWWDPPDCYRVYTYLNINSVFGGKR